MCKSILKGQNVPGTDGTYHGTDGTCPRDRRDAHQGVSRQNSLCLLVFFFRERQRGREREKKIERERQEKKRRKQKRTQRECGGGGGMNQRLTCRLIAMQGWMRKHWESAASRGNASKFFFRDAPSLRSVVEFGVWHSWWISWWIFLGGFTQRKFCLDSSFKRQQQDGSMSPLKPHNSNVLVTR